MSSFIRRGSIEDLPDALDTEVLFIADDLKCVDALEPLALLLRLADEVRVPPANAFVANDKLGIHLQWDLLSFCGSFPFLHPRSLLPLFEDLFHDIRADIAPELFTGRETQLYSSPGRGHFEQLHLMKQSLIQCLTQQETLSNVRSVEADIQNGVSSSRSYRRSGLAGARASVSWCAGARFSNRA